MPKPSELVTEATQCLPPLMKAHGYKKHRRNFTKRTGESTAVLGIVSSTFNDHRTAQFYIDVGVYIPAIVQRSTIGDLKREPAHNVTTINQCTWTQDLSALAGTPQGSWEVMGTSPCEQINAEVFTMVKDVGIPWLEENVHLENFLNWLTTQTGFGAADTLWKFDRKEEAHHCLLRLPNRPNRPWGPTNQARVDEWLRRHPL
ncbi:MAG: DUF4304 domain-containing protein [Pseudomonadota bacterium]